MKLSVKNMQNIYQAFKGYRQTATSNINPADCLVYLVLVSYAAISLFGSSRNAFPDKRCVTTQIQAESTVGGQLSEFSRVP